MQQISPMARIPLRSVHRKSILSCIKQCHHLWKKDAYINLPKFDFDVERIDIISPAGGSGKTTRNIFVGNKAVSTQTTGAKGTHQYEIAADNQAANTVYTIKVTNANNDQIQKF